MVLGIWGWGLSEAQAATVEVFQCFNNLSGHTSASLVTISLLGDLHEEKLYSLLQRICDRAEETGERSQLERINASLPPGPSTCLSALMYHRLAAPSRHWKVPKMVPATRSAPFIGRVKQLNR